MRAKARTSVTEGRLDQLHAEFYPRVLAYCLRRAQPADAHEVAAATFEVAWRRLDVVPPGELALPWLYGVARNVLSHTYRRTRRQARLTARLQTRRERPEPGPEPQLVRSTEHELVAHAARQLSEADQEILRLHLWEELSHADAARVLGVQEQTARQRFHRAKRRLVDAYERLQMSGGGV